MVDGGAKLKMVAVPAKITDMLSELIDVCFWGEADMSLARVDVYIWTRSGHRNLLCFELRCMLPAWAGRGEPAPWRVALR